MVKETIVWPKSGIGRKMIFECLIKFKYNTYSCIINFLWYSIIIGLVLNISNY
jgi:hypothetical protein